MYFKIFFSNIDHLLRHLRIRNFQLALLCLICTCKSYGQIGTNSYGRIVAEITKEKRPKMIYTKVIIESAFSGGDSFWIKSLEKNLNESIILGKGVKKGKYLVSVAFIVSRDSSLTECHCENDPGYGMCQEIIKFIRKNKKWTPAIQNGRSVNAYRGSFKHL